MQPRYNDGPGPGAAANVVETGEVKLDGGERVHEQDNQQQHNVPRTIHPATVVRIQLKKGVRDSSRISLRKETVVKNYRTMRPEDRPPFVQVFMHCPDVGQNTNRVPL